MIAAAVVISVAYLGGVALALYGLSKMADTSLFTWTDEDE